MFSLYTPLTRLPRGPSDLRLVSVGTEDDHTVRPPILCTAIHTELTSEPDPGLAMAVHASRTRDSSDGGGSLDRI